MKIEVVPPPLTCTARNVTKTISSSSGTTVTRNANVCIGTTIRVKHDVGKRIDEDDSKANLNGRDVQRKNVVNAIDKSSLWAP